jgi:hypothetical protein
MNTLTFSASAAPASASSAPAVPAHAPFRIAAGAVLALRHGRGLRVEVMEGRLWITAAGDTQDHFVGPGGRHALGQAHAVVIENVGSGTALLRLVPGT